MEREDPLERIAREERERKERKGQGGPLKIITIVLALVAVALAVLLFIVRGRSAEYHSLVSELTVEKDSLTKQFEALQMDYANLSSDYESINSALDSSREEINLLVERLKKASATDRSTIRKYEAELGTLRSIMRNYIVQIDSLNTLNHQLTAEAAEARKDAAESKRMNANLSKQVKSLSGQIAVGSVIKARGLRLEAYTANDKIVDKASRATRMLVSLSLTENDLAERGPVRVYVRVTAPDGSLLRDGSGTTFTISGESFDATASREVDYEGSEIEMSIYVNNIAKFNPGTYTMEAFTVNGKLGDAALVLR
ncbi:MAG: hypothetical protein MJY42_01180 [Bacteroidales bacterium]|nr:hypothetical protein [Bacteroidales bacterium]